MFPLLTMYQGLHFYLLHRPLYWPPLYRWVHSIHHCNTNLGPWSGLSMHPFEHLLYFSSLLIFFILPSHPVHMLFLLFWQLFGAPSGHSGYEAVYAKGKQRLAVAGSTTSCITTILGAIMVMRNFHLTNGSAHIMTESRRRPKPYVNADFVCTTTKCA